MPLNGGITSLRCSILSQEYSLNLLDSARLLLDLQRASEIAQTLSGCIEPDAIAKRVTDGLVEKFGCAFARIWLVESDQTALRLVASSGMYTQSMARSRAYLWEPLRLERLLKIEFRF